MNKRVLYCNFCGKSCDEVAQLVAGPDCYICNECIILCWDIIDPIRRGNIEFDSWASA